MLLFEIQYSASNLFQIKKLWIQPVFSYYLLSWRTANPISSRVLSDEQTLPLTHLGSDLYETLVSNLLRDMSKARSQQFVT